MSRQRILMIKTRYPHWGGHTAFNSFTSFFDSRRFAITLRDVPLGDGRWIPARLGRWARRKIAGRGMQEYRLNDLLAEAGALRRVLFRRTDVVHFLDAEHSFLFLPAWQERFARLGARARLVAMFHQPPSVFERYPLINREIVRRADRVLVVSPVQADYFARFLSRDRIVTILLGVDSGHFTPAPGGTRRPPFKCLAGGVWLRDYDTLFRTAALLRNDPGIEFHVVAPPPAGPPPPGRIIWHQRISDAELLDLYRTCHILFQPLQDTTANTFLLEGSACGLPILANRLPSLEVYFPGDEAVLVTGSDPTAFAAELTALAGAPERLDWMSACARRRAQQLDWNLICRQYEGLYRDLA